MHASEILGRRVLDAHGHDLGPLRDLRIRKATGVDALVVEWLVVGGREWAHRFGYVDGRTRGPAVIKLLLRQGRTDSAIAVPASSVASWGPEEIRLRGDGQSHAVPVSTAAERW